MVSEGACPPRQLDVKAEEFFLLLKRHLAGQSVGKHTIFGKSESRPICHILSPHVIYDLILSDILCDIPGGPKS